MGSIIALLTIAMILLCGSVIFLVLIQFPKKEAAAGLAFGGTETNNRFGAGSGTVLTKITRYAASAFFVLARLLSILQSHRFPAGVSGFLPAPPPPGVSTQQ